MVNTLANIDMMTWLWYAYVGGVSDHLINVVIIFGVAMVVTVVLFGVFWGKGWNRTWSLAATPLRITWVIALAFICSWSLTAVDALYGSHYFNSSIASQFQVIKSLSADKEGNVNLVGNKPGAGQGVDDSAARQFLYDFYQANVKDKVARVAKGKDESDAKIDKNTINQMINAHSDALVSAWSLAGLSFILLLLGVAFVAFKGIKVVRPVVSD